MPQAGVPAVLANASFRRPAVKAEVQRLGCVELMLSQCQADPNSPLAREWALWGVRNICEGNEKAQVGSAGVSFNSTICSWWVLNKWTVMTC